MEIKEKRKWISLTLLSIVVPMSFLTMFRLAGILQEPLAISETKTLEPLKWKIERPSYTIDIDDEVNSFYNDENISVNSSVYVYIYDDSWGWGVIRLCRYDYKCDSSS